MLIVDGRFRKNAARFPASTAVSGMRTGAARCASTGSSARGNPSFLTAWALCCKAFCSSFTIGTQKRTENNAFPPLLFLV